MTMMAVEIPALFPRDRISQAPLIETKRCRGNSDKDDGDPPGQVVELVVALPHQSKRARVDSHSSDGNEESLESSLLDTCQDPSSSRLHGRYHEKHDRLPHEASAKDRREVAPSKVTNASSLSVVEQPLSLKSILLRKQQPKVPQRPRLLTGALYSKYRALCWMDEEYTKPVVKKCSRRVTWLNEEKDGSESSPVAQEYPIPAIAPAGSYCKRFRRKRMQFKHRDAGCEWNPALTAEPNSNKNPAVVVSEEEEEEDADDCHVDGDDENEEHPGWFNRAGDSKNILLLDEPIASRVLN